MHTLLMRRIPQKLSDNPEKTSEVTIKKEFVKFSTAGLLTVSLGNTRCHLQVYKDKFLPSGHVDNESYSPQKLYNTCATARTILRLETSEEVSSLLDLARLWLTDCEQNHQHCSPSNTFFPTRVLDLGVDDGSRNIHLHLSTENDYDNAYVALSHCWGQQNEENWTARTTPENILEHIHGISVDSLPACFRDAIYVTRRLGIRYLWIDSLCIIQEESPCIDWVKESSIMAQVYSCSALTISAAASDRSSAGFLTERTNEPPEVQLRADVLGERNTLAVRAFPPAIDSALERCTISQRGWTKQERLLSRKILHFTRSQMYWQCLNGVFFEDGSTSPLSDSILTLLRNCGRKEASHIWWNTVQNYKDLQFSKLEDCLPSLAGIARIVSENLQTDYLAGIWACHLPWSLLWHTLDAPRQTTFALDACGGRLPSWSWAKASGRVRQPYEMSQIDWSTCSENVFVTVESISAQAETEGDLFLGCLTKASIVLSGLLRKVKIKPSRDVHKFDVLLSQGLRQPPNPSDLLQYAAFGRWTVAHWNLELTERLRASGEYHNSTSFIAYLDQDISDMTEYWFLPICAGFDAYAYCRKIIYALLLKESEGSQQRFLRVGVAHSSLLYETDILTVIKTEARQRVELV